MTRTTGLWVSYAIQAGRRTDKVLRWDGDEREARRWAEPGREIVWVPGLTWAQARRQARESEAACGKFDPGQSPSKLMHLRQRAPAGLPAERKLAGLLASIREKVEEAGSGGMLLADAVAALASEGRDPYAGERLGARYRVQCKIKRHSRIPGVRVEVHSIPGKQKKAYVLYPRTPDEKK